MPESGFIGFKDEQDVNETHAISWNPLHSCMGLATGEIFQLFYFSTKPKNPAIKLIPQLQI